MVNRKHFLIVLIAFFGGCIPTVESTHQTPEDFEPYILQAAAYVKRTDSDLNVQNELDSILRSLGCMNDGGSYIANGTQASVSYSELPYLMVGVLLTGDEQLDVRIYYNRNRQDELEDWMSRFQSAVDGKKGLSCEVYEVPSSGPF